MPIYQVDPEYFDRFMRDTILGINSATKVMIEQCEPAIPTFYLRYEDLILKPEPVLRELFCFLLEVPSLDGTVAEKRI